MDEQRLNSIESKVNDIHKAMVGDEYGNDGYMQWRVKVDRFIQKYERIIWLITGGAAVVTIVVNMVFKLI